MFSNFFVVFFFCCCSNSLQIAAAATAKVSKMRSFTLGAGLLLLNSRLISVHDYDTQCSLTKCLFAQTSILIMFSSIEQILHDLLNKYSWPNPFLNICIYYYMQTMHAWQTGHVSPHITRCTMHMLQACSFVFHQHACLLHTAIALSLSSSLVFSSCLLKRFHDLRTNNRNRLCI